MAPSKTSSMLGWLAAVTDTESPSQLSPAVIHSMWTSFTAGGRCVFCPYGGVTAAISAPPFLLLLPVSARPHTPSRNRGAAAHVSANARQLFMKRQIDNPRATDLRFHHHHPGMRFHSAPDRHCLPSFRRAPHRPQHGVRA